jgi:hydroxyacylglutathione hydrolase
MVQRIIVGLLSTNCYIYSVDGKECLIIDPGGDAEEILSRLSDMNLTVKGVAFTHGHLDHVAGIVALRSQLEAKGRVPRCTIHPADRGYLGPKSGTAHSRDLRSLGLDSALFADAVFSSFPPPDVLLRSGRKVLGTDLTVIETPGHTPGSVCFYSEKGALLFSGDTLFCEGVGRTDLPGGDANRLSTSIRKKLMNLPPQTRVFPGHGPDTTLERERRGHPEWQ